MSTIPYPKRGATGEASRVVSFSPSQVYAIISNPTEIPNWSPECHTVELVEPSQPVRVGTRFKGINKDAYLSWTTICKVERMTENKEFTFRIIKGVFMARTRWLYLLQPENGGTRITERYEIIRANPWPIRQFTMGKRHDNDELRPINLVRNIEKSLENLEKFLRSVYGV